MADSAIIQEMKKAIGTFPVPEFPPEDVTIWNILRFASATEDPNPLWRDQEYAKKTRWGGIIAPPYFVENFSPPNRLFRERGGQQHEYPFPFKVPFDRVFYGGDDMEFFVPIRPGDAISCKCVLADVFEKQSTRGAGRLIFPVFEKKYYNQRQELVARASWSEIFAEFAPPQPPSDSMPVAEEPVAPGGVTLDQLFFEDVQVGALLPSLKRHVVMTTIVKWAGATGDAGRPHFDYKFIRDVYGMTDVLAHGPLTSAYLAQLITNWIGGDGVLKKHVAQIRGNVFPDDVVTCHGKVARKRNEQDDCLVEFETWAMNQRGQKVAVGSAIAALPSKRRGH